MNKKIESEIAIGVLVIVAVLVGGAFLMQSEKAQAPVAEPVAMQPTAPVAQTQPVTSSATQPTQANQTANWQTYNNSTFFLTFKYPASLTSSKEDKSFDQTGQAGIEFLATGNSDISQGLSVSISNGKKVDYNLDSATIEKAKTAQNGDVLKTENFQANGQTVKDEYLKFGGNIFVRQTAGIGDKMMSYLYDSNKNITYSFVTDNANIDFTDILSSVQISQ